MKKHLILFGGILAIASLLLAGCVDGDGATETPTETMIESDSETVETAPEETSETAEETFASEETAEDYFEATRIETVAPDTSKVIDVAVTDKGYDIFRLAEDQSFGYRYGATYLYNPDGSVDAYFACPGSIHGEWDWITYRHSDDGGETWSDEKIVLTPTEESLDHFSTCDPGVVYFDGYYYLGYTSTLNELGMCNNVFVARSENPDGPFEKWNGNGWGGYDPQPIFYYDEAYEKFGMGEPSFVELNGTLYIYYSILSPSGDYTMVATADATDENWPATIQTHGVAVKRDTDSLDVKYVEDWGKFIAVAAGDRFGEDSWLGIFESNDGLSFELVDVVREGTFSALHNVGISSRPNGHIRLSEDADRLRVIYAYGQDWGIWNTRVQPVTLKLSRGNDLIAERRKDCIGEFTRGESVSKADREIVMVRPLGNVHSYSLSYKSFTLRINAFNSYMEGTSLRPGAEGVTFRVQDPSVCSVDPATWLVTLKSVGTTTVEVLYKDLSYVFHVTVTDDNDTASAELIPVRDTYTIYVGESYLYRPMLRVRTELINGSVTEYYVTASNTVVTYEGYDPAVIWVDAKGTVTAVGVGETEVTVTADGKTCKIKVIVSDDPDDAFYRSAKLSAD